MDVHKMIKNYVSSLKNKKIFRGFFLDIVFGLGMFILFSIVGLLLQVKSGPLQGVALQNLKNQLLSSPELAQTLLTDLRAFLFILILSILILIVGSLLFFSFTRSLIWNNLINKKFSKKRYWRWNVFALLIPFHLLPYFVLYFLIKSVINIVLSPTSTLIGLINAFITLALLIFFPLIIFILMYSFAQEYRVWNSFAHSYKIIKHKWSKLKYIYLFALGTAIILNIIIFGLEKIMPVSIITGILFLLYIAWLRVYITRTINSS